MHDIQLILQDLVHPLDISGPCQIKFFIYALLGNVECHARFRQLGQQADHFVAACQMLIEVAEVRLQILQMGFVVEVFHPFQHQRQVDHHRQKQWCECEQKKEQ